MSVALLIIGDGRDDLHERAWESAQQALPMNLFDHKIVVDDRDHKLGFAGAIRHGWEQILNAGDVDWVFHLEADFLFNEEVPLERMIHVLEQHPDVAQIVLKRQAWNPQEKQAGGIVEQHPDDYQEVRLAGELVTVHRRFWSTNPSVYHVRYPRVGWPQVPESEGKFTHHLLRDPHLRFAFWGGKLDAPRVEHIGNVRTGTGY